jgi:hypothetical protein
MSDTAILQAEYLAATEAYASAQKRLTAAKAALDAVAKREAKTRREARHAERLERSAKALEAWLAGATQKTACQIVGLSPAGASFYAIRRYFVHNLLSFEERYSTSCQASWTRKDFDERDRAQVAQALARFHENVAP